jgi:hypothetical protein
MQVLELRVILTILFFVFIVSVQILTLKFFDKQYLTKKIAILQLNFFISDKLCEALLKHYNVMLALIKN